MQAELPADDPAEAAYAAGDFSRAAWLAGSDELRGCALVMMGALEEGLPLIESAVSPRAQFCCALAYWGMERFEDARRRLDSIAADAPLGAAARRLARLMRRERIHILVQGRDDPRCPDYDLIGALRAIPYADVRSVGYAPGTDIVIDYTSTLAEVLEQLPPGWTPDLYLNHLVEDNPPPVGIADAPFPTFVHSQDYDRHVHHVRGYLPLFDRVIALGSADHADLAALSGRPTLVYPLLLGVDIDNSRDLDLPRSTDVYLSGSLFNNGLKKAAHVFEISQLPEHYQVRMVEGFTTPNTYFNELARSKATFTYVNRWGALNGRAVEAISVGTCALVQAGTELQFFVRPEEGAIPFTSENFLSVLRDVVDNWDSRYARYGHAGARRVREVFNFKRCIRRYFHLLAASACAVDVGARPARPADTAIRYPSRSPWRIRFHFRDTEQILRLQDRFRRAVTAGGDYRHLDAAGESFLYSYLTLKKSEGYDDAMAGVGARLLAAAVRVYELLVAHHPQRMAARFNLARLYVEQGETQRAAQAFRQLLSTPGLVYHQDDLLFWKELQEDLFDYDLVMEASVDWLKHGDESQRASIEAAILDSATLYLATLCVDERDAGQALQVLETRKDALNFAPALTLRGMLRLSLGDAAQAEADLRRAHAMRPWEITRLDPALFALAARRARSLDDIAAQRERLAVRMRRLASS